MVIYQNMVNLDMIIKKYETLHDYYVNVSEKKGYMTETPEWYKEEFRIATNRMKAYKRYDKKEGLNKGRIIGAFLTSERADWLLKNAGAKFDEKTVLSPLLPFKV